MTMTDRGLADIRAPDVSVWISTSWGVTELSLCSGLQVVRPGNWGRDLCLSNLEKDWVDWFDVGMYDRF